MGASALKRTPGFWQRRWAAAALPVKGGGGENAGSHVVAPSQLYTLTLHLWQPLVLLAAPPASRRTMRCIMLVLGGSTSSPTRPSGHTLGPMAPPRRLIRNLSPSVHIAKLCCTACPALPCAARWCRAAPALHHAPPHPPHPTPPPTPPHTHTPHPTPPTHPTTPPTHTHPTHTSHTHAQLPQPPHPTPTPVGLSLQYMTLRNRQGRLERAGQLYNWRQARRIVTLLCDMTAKAVRVRDAADSQLSDLLGELEATHGYHTPQVRCVA